MSLVGDFSKLINIERNRDEMGDRRMTAEVEGREPSCGMANKYKEETLLPMNIWIDEAGSYKHGGQGKRILFQLNKSDDFENGNIGSMDLDGNTSVLGVLEFAEDELNRLRNFVRNNRYALERIADQKVRLYRIWPDMIKGGELASKEDVKILNGKVDKLVSEKIVMKDFDDPTR